MMAITIDNKEAVCSELEIKVEKLGYENYYIFLNKYYHSLCIIDSGYVKDSDHLRKILTFIILSNTFSADITKKGIQPLRVIIGPDGYGKKKNGPVNRSD